MRRSLRAAACEPNSQSSVSWLRLLWCTSSGSDVFETLALELFRKCDPKEMASFNQVPSDFYVVLDEAQHLATSFSPLAKKTQTNAFP